MSGLLERFIFSEREHHYRLVAVARDKDRCVVLTDTVNRRRKIFSRRGVSDRLDLDRILSSSDEYNCFRKNSVGTG